LDALIGPSTTPQFTQSERLVRCLQPSLANPNNSTVHIPSSQLQPSQLHPQRRPTTTSIDRRLPRGHLRFNQALDHCCLFSFAALLSPFKASLTSGVSRPMSLLATSTDVQDRDLPGRKRSHGDFLGQEPCGSAVFRDSVRQPKPLRPRPRCAVADDDPRGARKAFIQYLGNDTDIRVDVRGNDKGPINVGDPELGKRDVCTRQAE